MAPYSSSTSTSTSTSVTEQTHPVKFTFELPEAEMPFASAPVDSGAAEIKVAPIAPAPVFDGKPAGLFTSFLTPTPTTPPVTPAMNGLPIFGGEASLFALPGQKNPFKEGNEFWNRGGVGGTGQLVKVEEKEESMQVRLEKVEESMATMSLVSKDIVEAGFAKVNDGILSFEKAFQDQIEENTARVSLMDKDVDSKAIARIEGTSKQLFQGTIQCAVQIGDVQTWAQAFTAAQSAHNRSQVTLLEKCAGDIDTILASTEELKALLKATIRENADIQNAYNLAVLNKLDFLAQKIDQMVTKKELLALLEDLRLESEEGWEIDDEGLAQIVFPQGEDREEKKFVVPINQAGRGNAGAGWCVVM